MFSIDQNCHSLWDVVPKLQAVTRRGAGVTHYVEDVDVAFTSLGSRVGEPNLRIAQERFHRSGGQDWGAAMFYSQFLGRLPVEIRHWEPYVGMKVAALAKQLRRSVDELYDEFSPADNWQLIGSSYVADRRHHRLIGDLTVRETHDHLLEVLDIGRRDCLERFPQADSRRRIREWFDEETGRVRTLLGQLDGAPLTDLYAAWLQRHVGDSVEFDVASSLFSWKAHPDRLVLPELFLRDYERAAGIYNQAIDETALDLRPLETEKGELPFFAVLRTDGRLVRVAVHLRDNELLIGKRAIRLAPGRLMPVDALKQAGVQCCPGKAMLLVLQVRLGEAGRPLVVPFRGSLYMPAAYALERKLREAGLLKAPMRPVVRVRFRLLDRMKAIDTAISLPEHLRPYFGREEIPARELGENWRRLSVDAAERLECFKDAEYRQRWQRRNLPELSRRIDALDAERRRLAKIDPKAREIREVSKQAGDARAKSMYEMLRQIARDWQMSRIDVWDSRGALLPWCVALGGRRFYDTVIDNAQIYEEDPDNPD